MPFLPRIVSYRTVSEGQSGSIQVRRLLLYGYRRFGTLDFAPAQLNVILGVNGSGKSALLQSLAVGLSRLTSRITSGRSGGLLVSNEDIPIDSTSASVIVMVERDGALYDQVVNRTKKGRNPASRTYEVEPRFVDPRRSMAQLSKLADLYRAELTSNDAASVPVIVMYPVNRAVTQIPARRRRRTSFDQVTAFDGAFDGQRNFRTFFEWFREREEFENEVRTEDQRHRDPQLQAVRQALERLMPGYENLRVKRSPLRMTVQKGAEGEFLINQLSDGEKVLLSLVGDLARRLAVANPSVADPLAGEGIVMVDEVDLHLHPSWQRRIVTQLPAVFPGVQFFLTTHSPVIASAVHPENLWLLREGEIYHAEAYGQDVALVLSELFDTPPRIEEVRDQLDQLFEAIRFQKVDQANQTLSELDSAIGNSDPDLVKARTLLRGFAGV